MRTFNLTNTEKVIKCEISIFLSGYVLNFIIQNESRTMIQLQYVEWSQQACPDNYTSLINLIDAVETVQHKTNNEPIVVHCR